MNSTSILAHVNRFMNNTDRISALRNARKVIKNRDRKLAKMRLRLDVLTSSGGIQLGNDIQEDIADIVQAHHPEIESLPMSDFRRVFWNQQVYSCRLATFTYILLKLIGICSASETQDECPLAPTLC